MRHKLCRSFHPWCPGVKNRCLFYLGSTFTTNRDHVWDKSVFLLRMTWHAAWRGTHAPKPKTGFLKKRVWGKAVTVFYRTNKSCNDNLKNVWCVIYDNTTLGIRYSTQAGHCLSLGRKSARALSNKTCTCKYKKISKDDYTFQSVCYFSKFHPLCHLIAETNLKSLPAKRKERIVS